MPSQNGWSVYDIDDKFNAGDIVKTVFPTGRVTEVKRDANSPLGRANPNSTHIGRTDTIDMAPIPGMSFDEAKGHFESHGYSVLYGQDEVNNPSKHATGPHWHFQLAKTFNPSTEGWSVEGQPVKTASRPAAPAAAPQYPVRVALPESQAVAPAAANVVSAPEQPRSWLEKTADQFNLAGQLGTTGDVARYANQWLDTGKDTLRRMYPNDTEAQLEQRHTAAVNKGQRDLIAELERRNEKDPTWQGWGQFAQDLVTAPYNPAAMAKYSPAVIGSLGGLGIENLIAPGGSAIARVLGQLGVGLASDAVSQDLRIQDNVQDEFSPEQMAMNGVFGAAFQGAGELAGQAAKRLSPEVEAGWKDVLNSGTKEQILAYPEQNGFAVKHEDLDAFIAARDGKSATAVYAEGKTPSTIPSQMPSEAPYSAKNAPEVVTPLTRPRGAPEALPDKPSKESVSKLIGETISGWKNAPEIVVHKNNRALSKAEPEIWAGMKADKATSAMGLVGADGKVHIVAGNVKNHDIVPAIVYHEALGHSGLGQEFTDGLDKLLEGLYRTNGKLRAEANAIRGKTPVYDSHSNPIPRYVEEALAKRSEGGKIDAGVIDRLSAYIRSYGRKMGLDLRYSDREVRAILARAHDNIINGPKATATDGSGTRYMYGSNKDRDIYVDPIADTSWDGKEFHTIRYRDPETGQSVAKGAVWKDGPIVFTDGKGNDLPLSKTEKEAIRSRIHPDNVEEPTIGTKEQLTNYNDPTDVKDVTTYTTEELQKHLSDRLKAPYQEYPNNRYMVPIKNPHDEIDIFAKTADTLLDRIATQGKEYTVPETDAFVSSFEKALANFHGLRGADPEFDTKVDDLSRKVTSLEDYWNHGKPEDQRYMLPEDEYLRAPNSPAEGDEDLIKRFTNSLSSAQALQGTQADLYRKARAAKFKAAKEVGKKTRGESGYHKELGMLKGELPKVDFEPTRDNFSQKELNALFNYAKRAKGLDWTQTVRARQGLAKLLDGELPTKSEMALLGKVFPEDFVKAALHKYMLVEDARPTSRKLLDSATNVLSIPRALMSSYDLSAPFRQGIFLIRRKEFWRSLAEMPKHFGADFHKQAELDIQARPSFPVMEDAGLFLADSGHKLTTREEDFVSPLAEYIPGVKASNRTYAGFLNKLRADVFDDMVAQAQKAGIDFEANPKTLKDIARYINTATGRGGLGGFEGAATDLANIFFSPRLLSSRVALLNPATYIGLDPFVRREAVKDLLAFAGLGTTVLGLASMAGAKVETDPRSSDFAKIRVDNTRYDILGGFGQYITLGAKLLTNEKLSASGQKQELGSKYGGPTALGEFGTFLRNKLSPVMSFIVDAREGKNSIGEPFTFDKALADRFAPLFLKDVYDALQDGGLDQAAMALPGIVGIGYQNYDESESRTTGLSSQFREKYTDNPGIEEIKRLSDAHGDNVINPVSGNDLRKYDDNPNPEVLKQYHDKTEAEIAAALPELISLPEYKQATDEERIKIVKEEVAAIRKQIREEMFEGTPSPVQSQDGWKVEP